VKYLGMNQQSGKAITDIDHVRQSVRDILLTPQGSRIARRTYGSVLFRLTDQTQNGAIRLQVMAAIYTALATWEPRVQLDAISLTTAADGSMTAELTGRRSDGAPLSLTVPTGVTGGTD